MKKQSKSAKNFKANFKVVHCPQITIFNAKQLCIVSVWSYLKAMLIFELKRKSLDWCFWSIKKIFLGDCLSESQHGFWNLSSHLSQKAEYQAKGTNCLVHYFCGECVSRRVKNSSNFGALLWHKMPSYVIFPKYVQSRFIIHISNHSYVTSPVVPTTSGFFRPPPPNLYWSAL